MHERYIELFGEVARVMTLLLENALEYNYQQKDKEGIETATTMRDKYIHLQDKVQSKDFDPATLTRVEYIEFLIGFLTIAQNIEERIKRDELALNGYKTLMIPKLEKIMNETENDEQAKILSAEIFQTLEEN